jgi:CPA2 family monovalent cation:H+ antiporter-2
MIEQPFIQVLLLLGTAVVVVLAFQRLHIPSSLGYLLVGILLGPYTAGPVIESQQLRPIAEFGIVFLLFTIGLNFSLPQIHALRHQVLGLGTAQVALTTAAVGLIAWIAGLPPEAAFVVGAVFAQSSTTVISKQLAEQGEENSRHGRLAVALSVFQDVTAVPFVIIIPVLGAASAAEMLASSLAWALAKAILAFFLVFIAARRLLRPLFHLVAERRSAEIFTLTVLFVSLSAAWITYRLGLSLAFGAFLAGMVLGETEFRHQVESTIRPFRDVLLGLFFIGIGMLIDPVSIPRIWHWALGGMFVLMVSKTLLVAVIVKWAGHDPIMAWRTGLLIAVGGEFGFAVLAIALQARAIDPYTGQVVLTSVLLSMIAAPFLIRYNHDLANLFAARPARVPHDDQVPRAAVAATGEYRDHVIICGYGRIGQNVGHFLEEEKISYVALDTDPVMVKNAHLAGEPVFYGDAAERDILDAVSISTARLVVISHEDVAAAHKTLHHIRSVHPDLPVMVRTRDESHVEELRSAGATEVVAETLEAGLMIAVHALILLNVPLPRIVRRMQEQRNSRYRLLRELFQGNMLTESSEETKAYRLRPVLLPPDSPAVGRWLGEFNLDGVVVTALVRKGNRQLSPPPETLLEADDALVLFGSFDDLEKAERALLG